MKMKANGAARTRLFMVTSSLVDRGFAEGIDATLRQIPACPEDEGQGEAVGIAEDEEGKRAKHLKSPDGADGRDFRPRRRISRP
jgi:hypothetical protein